MDSDSSENSSSEYSTTDSSDDDGMETAEVLGDKLQIPQGLCEKFEIFKEVLSTSTWNSLSERNRHYLQQFLPEFPDNDLEEKNKTLQHLFNYSEFRFKSNPLQAFHDHLKAGYFRPDIAKMRHLIRKSQRREARYRYKMLREKMKSDLVESQKRILNQVRNMPPGAEPKVEKPNISATDRISHITKKRYFQVLSTIRAKSEDLGFSSDENYPEGPPSHLSRKQKRHLNSLKNSVLNSEKLVVSTVSQKHNGLDLDDYVTSNYNPFYINDEMYKTLILQHKRRKLQYDSSPELNTKGISLIDVINRTQLPYFKNPSIITNKHHIDHKITAKKKIKKEVTEPLKPAAYLGHSSNSDDSDSDSYIDAVSLNNTFRNKHKTSKTNKPLPKVHIPNKPKQEVKKENPEIVPPSPVESPPVSVSNLIKPINNFSQYGKVAPLTLSELEGIDMMNLPIDLDNSDIDILDLNNKPELMQETHSNFLSLIRDVICSTAEHRMNLKALEDRLKSWQENPISPLNDWYNLCDNWIDLLISAVDFLCGNFADLPEDFVPYMEHKISIDMYQWIGAGRDSDNLLLPLCQYWLDHRSENKVEIKEEIDVEVSDRSHSPPPPRCPTTWTVRKASPEEIRDFQEQERRRYNNPHKAFTYRCNGYESVVGPLKGIYNPNIGNAKARGHTMLTADRPNFVTLLSLVRDATARLPNGEGTRADICELLKCSQYISSTAADSVLQTVVSGALDRMHTQFDPCVKYDPKRKIWIYLHRNRTEEDFERIHQQCQGMNKTSKKSSSKKTPTKTKSKSDKNTKIIKSEAAQSTDQIKQVKGKGSQVSSPTPSTLQNTSSISKPAPTKPTSLLLSNNRPNSADQSSSSRQQVDSPSQTSQSPTVLTQEEKELNTALQSIVQNRVASPVPPKQLPKSTKGLVKIISPSQGKSLIVPANSSQAIKQEKTKQVATQNVSQQLIQTVSTPQKQTIQLIQKSNEDKVVEQKIKVPVTIQQQIIQSINPQQFQNIKNVTLLRNIGSQSSNSSVPAIVPIPQNSESKVTTSDTKSTLPQDTVVQPSIQIKTPTTLTPAQQQQIFQTLKQKILPQTTILTPQQQQIILKQKAAGNIQKHNQIAPGTSLLGQPKVTDAAKSSITSSQSTPVVAKVLTNAAGQVISVESLVTHQKQQNALQQGATLRVSGGKGSQANVIQLTGTSKQNTITQFAVASQNNLIALTTQPKLVVASQTTTVTSTITNTKPVSRTVTKSQSQPVTKFPPKVAQQLINAKIITQGLDGQAKLIMGQTNPMKISSGKNVTMTKPVTLSVAANANTIRMVNAANLNLTHIGGKPVLLAGKGNTLQNIQGQNVILQTQPNTSGQQLVLQNAVKTIPATNSSGINILNQSNVVLAPQVKVQQSPQVVFSSAVKSTSAAVNQTNITQSHIVLGSHPMRLQTTNAGNTQRVVLASQGQGGQIVAQQILLPAGFQGTAINIKALQGVKVIPIAQAHGQGRGIQGRQVFARVMSPNVVKSSQTPSSSSSNSTSTNSGNSNEKIAVDSVITSNE